MSEGRSNYIYIAENDDFNINAVNLMLKYILMAGSDTCTTSGSLHNDLWNEPGQYLCQKGRLNYIYIAEK